MEVQRQRMSGAVHGRELRRVWRSSGIAIAAVLLSMGGISRALAAPTCSVGAPTANASVSGPAVALGAVASADATTVEFFLDSTQLGPAYPTIYGWFYSPNGGQTWGWNSRSVTDGTHALTCRALNAAGAQGTSPAVTFRVDNTAPSVFVGVPSAGAAVAGTTYLNAGGSDNVGISPYEARFFVDGNFVGVGPCTIYGCILAWDSDTVAQGGHVVTATLSDAAGNVGTSAPVDINVRSTCLPSLPATPADYQRAFDTRTYGWAGADGALPLTLPDGRVLWAFGDTYAGKVDGNNALVSGRLFAGNSFIVQSGRCFSSLLGGTVATPDTYVRSPKPAVFYWPSQGFVDTTVQPPVVRLWTGEVVHAPGGFGFGVVGADLITLSLPELQVRETRDVPYDQSLQNVPGFGTGTNMVSGDYVFFYAGAATFTSGGFVSGGLFAPGTHLARATRAKAATGPWTYWTGSGWSSTITKAKPLKLDDGTTNLPTGPGFSVAPYGVGYLLTARRADLESLFGPRIDAWYARKPQGPWHYVAQVVPYTTPPGSLFYYGSQLVTSVPGTSEASPMLVYSTNPTGCAPPTQCTTANDFRLNVLLYGPHFVAPQNLPSAAELANRFRS